MTKLRYALAGILPETGSMILGTFLLYTFKEMGISPWLITLVFVLDGILEMIADPIIGRISDRSRCRWGRRRPFMWTAAIVAPLAMFGNFSGWLWCVPVWTLVWSLSATPYNALAKALTEDPAEINDLIVWRSVVEKAGVIVAVLLFPFLSGKIGVKWAALVVGILAASTMIAAPKEKWSPVINTSSSIWSPIKDPKFRAFLARIIPGNAIVAVMIPLVPFIYGKEAAGIVLAIILVLVGALSPLAGKLGKKYGPQRVVLWSSWIMAASLAIVPFVSQFYYLAGGAIILIASIGGAGVIVGTLSYLTLIQPFSEEGSYAGAYKFFTKGIDNLILAYLAHILW